MSSSGGRVDYKSQVLGAIDIVELIGRSVALKQRGTNFVGLCPFHQEKSPSFSVNRARQFFHCFGCKASGNAIDFVMKRDRLEFIDALKQLGQQAGIEMPQHGVSKHKTGEKQVLYDANSAACAFFQQMLRDPEKGAAGRAYLEQRGFNVESVKQFQVGLAVDGWDALLKSPVGRKFTPQQLAAAGLVKAREGGGGFYDAFRNRLMFPIKDLQGRVIAFGGREMPGAKNPPKYLNSPETTVFSKKSTAFGLNLALQNIQETRTAVVVEGYTDVVMAHQFGATNVVSPLGTALTEEHIKTFRRFLDDEKQPGRIVLLFDADVAGDTAVDRSVGLFLTQNIEIAIASLPEGVDPDEFLLNEGLEGFETLIAAAPDALTYKWKRLSERVNADNSLTGRQRAVEEYLELLASARGTGPVNLMRWGMVLARLQRLTGIPEQQLNRQFRLTKAASRKNAPGLEKPQFGAGPNPMNASPGGNGNAGPAQARRPLNARDKAERQIIGLLLARPEWWDAVQMHVGPADFTDDARRRLAEAYWNHQRHEGPPVFNEFLGLLGDDQDTTLRELAVEALDAVESLPDPKAQMEQAVRFLQEEQRRQEGEKLVTDWKRTNGKDRPEQAEIDLLRKVAEQARRPDLRRT